MKFLERWTSLTDLREGSSGGPSPLPYDRLFDLGPTTSPGIVVAELPLATFDGTVASFPVTGEGELALKKKIIGCIALAMMPPEAVDEAFQSLKDIWEFHCGSTRAAQSSLLGAPKMSGGTGRIIGTARRPNLVLGG